jgi:hypothetical protein
MIHAKQWVIHENYTNNRTVLNNDIGLIQLSLRATYNRNVSTIPINILNATRFYTGRNVTVSGWGLTRDNTSVTPTKLQYTNVRIINTTSCQQTWPFVDNKIICAVPPVADRIQSSCRGLYIDLPITILSNFLHR